MIVAIPAISSAVSPFTRRAVTKETQLRWSGLTIHDFPHHCAGLIHREGLASDQGFYSFSNQGLIQSR